MICTPVIRALALPGEARVDQRVPKKLLLEVGAPTATDKRRIQDGIEELIWVAALKPTNIGVPAFRDAVREYLEIAVLTVTFRSETKPARLIELVHRAIPYPLVLLAETGDTVCLSLAHKRWSQGEGGKVVIEELRCTAPFKPDAPTAEQTPFLASLAVANLPNNNLFTVYQGWMDRLAALEAAQITGRFAPAESADRAAAMRDGLDNYTRIQRDIAILRAQAEKEKQIPRQVELNLAIKRLQAEQAEHLNKLQQRQ